MARPRTFDREEALDQAVQVFWSRGYEATSIADLENAMGLGRQSIYNTFGDKRQLFLEALDRYASQAAPADKVQRESGLAAVRRFFVDAVDFLSGPGAGRGCFLVRSLMDQGHEPDVGSRCQRNETANVALLQRHLEEALGAGELREDVDPAVAAHLLYTHMAGLSAAAAQGVRARQLQAQTDLLLSGLEA